MVLRGKVNIIGKTRVDCEIDGKIFRFAKLVCVEQKKGQTDVEGFIPEKIDCRCDYEDYKNIEVPAIYECDVDVSGKIKILSNFDYIEQFELSTVK